MSDHVVDSTALAAALDAMRRLSQDSVPDAERIDRIALLEQVKSVAAAAQAQESAAFAAAQLATQRAAGVKAKELGRGIAAQIGLARRISPHRAGRELGWASILIAELPGTFAALAEGVVSERRALTIARETVFLSREHRLVVDEQLAPQLRSLSDRQVEAAARRIGYRLDPEAFVARRAAAEKDRRVWVRPAPDTMVRLTALLPVAQGVAAYAALARAADTTTGSGDDRGRGQIMADTLVQRVTGQSSATDVPVTVNLVMTDTALLDPASEASNEPAHLDGYGPIPADAARALVTDASESTPMWIRRLYLSANANQLVAMDSKRRDFTPGQRLFIRLRDQFCRTSYCDAPVRHTDHIVRAADGGPTSVENARGSCEACNYAKEAPGWRTAVIDNEDGTHEVETITPTGHRYRSRAPDPPGDSVGHPTRCQV